MNDAERENEIFIKLKLYFGFAITHNGPPSVFLWIVTNLSATTFLLYQNMLLETLKETSLIIRSTKKTEAFQDCFKLSEASKTVLNVLNISKCYRELF